MKVILAVDDSPYSEAAVQQVIRQPWWEDTEFLVLNIVQMVSMAYSGPTFHPERFCLLRDAEIEMGIKLVNRVAKQISEALPFARVEHGVVEGNISREIVERAKAWNADLIVVGSQGRKGLQKFLLGSVAQTVASEAPCSVEIVRIGLGKQPEHEKELSMLAHQTLVS